MSIIYIVIQVDEGEHVLKAFYNKKKAVEYMNSLEWDDDTSYVTIETVLC